MFSSSFSLLAFMGVQAGGSGKVFNWLASLTAVGGLISWVCISYTYTRFYAGMKAQGIDRKTLPFASPLQPFAAWYALICCLVICLVRLSVAIHLELNADQKKPIVLHSSAAGRSSFMGTGTRPPLSQITCPL
jgi:amino acid permease